MMQKQSWQYTLYQTSNALIQQMLRPNAPQAMEQTLYPLLQGLLKQDMPLDLIQGVQSLFGKWHEQLHGKTLQLPSHNLDLAEINAHLQPTQNNTQHLQQLMNKAMQQPQHHLDFLELIYTCGKLGLRLPWQGEPANQYHMLDQLYYMIRAHRPLKEHLTATLPQLPTSSSLPHPKSTLGMRLAQLTVLCGTAQLLLLSISWFLGHFAF